MYRTIYCRKQKRARKRKSNKRVVNKKGNTVNRRARKCMSAAERKRRLGSYTKRKKKLFEEFEYTCSECNFTIKEQVKILDDMEKNIDRKKIKQFNDYKSLILSQMQIHHIIPLAKGGKNTKSNLVVLCEECHFLKEEELKKDEISTLSEMLGDGEIK
jgi:5-methylcytosine-specific restriction endonuclease McrA